MWAFRGSVAGTVAISTGGGVGPVMHGVDVAYYFDSRDGSWTVGVGYQLSSAALNVSVSVGASGQCRPEGDFLQGTVSAAVGEGGLVVATARGAKHCGEHRETSGVWVFEAFGPEDDAIYLDLGGARVWLEGVKLEMRGFIRDMTKSTQVDEQQDSSSFSSSSSSSGNGNTSTAALHALKLGQTRYRTKCMDRLGIEHANQVANDDNYPNYYLRLMRDDEEDEGEAPGASYQEGRSCPAANITGYDRCSEVDRHYPRCPAGSVMSAFAFFNDNLDGCACHGCAAADEPTYAAADTPGWEGLAPEIGRASCRERV